MRGDDSLGMTQTIEQKKLQDKRRRDRERKAAQRAAARAKGVPEKGLLYHAIGEAFGFSMVMVQKGLWDVAEAWGPVNSFLVVQVATDILVDRGGYDRTIVKRAVIDAIKPRPNWKDNTHTPTTDVETAMRRYRLAPPKWVTGRPRKPHTPPLLHQDVSAVSG